MTEVNLNSVGLRGDGERTQILFGRALAYDPLVVELAAVTGAVEVVTGSLQLSALVRALHPQRAVLVVREPVQVNGEFELFILNDDVLACERLIFFHVREFSLLYCNALRVEGTGDIVRCLATG